MEQFNKETNKTLEELKNRINHLVLYGFRYKQTQFFLHYQTTIRKVIDLLKDTFESGKYQKGDKVRIVFKNIIANDDLEGLVAEAQKQNPEIKNIPNWKIVDAIKRNFRKSFNELFNTFFDNRWKICEYLDSAHIARRKQKINLKNVDINIYDIIKDEMKYTIGPFLECSSFADNFDAFKSICLDAVETTGLYDKEATEVFKRFPTFFNTHLAAIYEVDKPLNTPPMRYVVCSGLQEITIEVLDARREEFEKILKNSKLSTDEKETKIFALIGVPSQETERSIA